MKIINCVHDDGLMTIGIVTMTPFGDEKIEMVYDVKQVFVSDPEANKIEVVKNE